MKYKLVALLCCLAFILGACGNSDTKKAAELNEQAKIHYTNGDLESSITVYEKSLELKEDAEIRQMLTDITEEADAVKEVKEYIEKLNDAKMSLYQASSYDDFIETAEEIDSITEKMVRISSPSGTEINKYIGSLEGDFDFFNIKAKTGLFLVETKFALPNDNETPRITELLDALDTFFEKKPLPDFYN